MDPQRPAGARPAPSLLERLMPSVMGARELHRRSARAWGALSVVVLVVGLAVAKDEIGVGFVLVMAAFFGARAWWSFRKLRQAPAGEQVVMNVDGLPVEDRAPALRRVTWIGGLAAAALAAWTAWSLWTLERGATESAYVWGPVGLVYRTFGFWPAVLVLPALCVLIVGSGWSKLRRLEREARDAARRRA